MPDTKQEMMHGNRHLLIELWADVAPAPLLLLL